MAKYRKLNPPPEDTDDSKTSKVRYYFFMEAYTSIH